jgi:hypothetical protein
MSGTQSGSLGGGTNVTLTDQVNGYLLIDNGSGAQESPRPISELTILQRQDVENGSDYEYVWDNSTAQLKRILATRASQLSYLGDGVNSTRTGSLGNINTNIYSSFDHIHPIIAITAPAVPTLTVASGGLTILQSLLATPITQDESVTFLLNVQCNIPAHTNTWQAINIPGIAGYKTVIPAVLGGYRQTGTPIGFPTAPYMGVEYTFWTPNLLYIGGFTENVATLRYLRISLTYVIA